MTLLAARCVAGPANKGSWSTKRAHQNLLIQKRAHGNLRLPENVLSVRSLVTDPIGRLIASSIFDVRRTRVSPCVESLVRGSVGVGVGVGMTPAAAGNMPRRVERAVG
jgi:GTP-dependent phosphoenolpyruvate carboxykinase